ncbi:MAG: response regulator [Heliobacteriaceae bacterium]|nr:response regulator [Heliobacteriaceae bacterium]MDD4588470.1 response regulator [Heliobacteriaceae bacterium]
MLNRIVCTNQERCKACSACLRVCQTKSIRIVDFKADIIEKSCLSCGLCVSACSKRAKQYWQSVPGVEQLLQSGRTALVLAPSYVIVARKKYGCTPEQFCTALHQVGFDLVYEASFGADVVSRVYVDYIDRLIKEKGPDNTHVITSPCPSLMNYVQKHTPELLGEFAPIYSPMAAQAILVRHWNQEPLAVVGANPCIAKKSELLDKKKQGLYDEDLTFEELITMLDARGIVPAQLPETQFDGIQAFYGAGFPISGGLTKTMELFADAATHFDPLSSEYLVVEGEYRSTVFLREMARRKVQEGNLAGYPLLIDVLYCEGCILGKALGVESDFLEKRRIIAEYTKNRFQRASQKGGVKNYGDYTVLVKNTVEAPDFGRWVEIVEELIRHNGFTRTWENTHYERKDPSEEELKYILESDGKLTVEDELNCGACGYLTCRERAKAVYNGENLLGGCIIHIKQEAKISFDENIRLHELDKMKSDFLSTVSHELRTPLTSVLGFAQIVKKRLDDVIYPRLDLTERKMGRAATQVKDNIGIIISESERLTALITDVLDIAKMEAGKVDWKSEPVAVATVIDRAAAATISLFDQKGLALIKDVEEDLPRVLGDNDRLIQTVINFLSNAVKFTEEGPVICRARRKNNEVIVSVSDKGVGIAAEDLPNVFEKFRQIGDTLTEKPQGTGLGLSICKQIVEQHGGRIWVESEFAKGSTFSFTVPFYRTAETEAKAADLDVGSLVRRLTDQVEIVTPSWMAGAKRILVVDDETNIRVFLRQELEAIGYEVCEAREGLEAINIAKKERPDLIILDIMMPRMSGFDVAAVLKNDPDTQNIPIVILSIVEDKQRGYRVGVDRYFTKPVNMNKLLKEVGLLIARGNSRKKVLVVDEDESALNSITEVLESKGFVVVKATTNDECIRKALAEKPDMIILDILFSGRHEVIKTLRFESGLEHVLFLLLGDAGKGSL